MQHGISCYYTTNERMIAYVCHLFMNPCLNPCISILQLVSHCIALLWLFMDIQFKRCIYNTLHALSKMISKTKAPLSEGTFAFESTLFFK